MMTDPDRATVRHPVPADVAPELNNSTEDNE